MVDYREILRLQDLKHNQRSIALETQSSRNTVSAVLVAAKAEGISWPLDDCFLQAPFVESCKIYIVILFLASENRVNDQCSGEQSQNNGCRSIAKSGCDSRDQRYTDDHANQLQCLTQRVRTVSRSLFSV